MDLLPTTLFFDSPLIRENHKVMAPRMHAGESLIMVSFLAMGDWSQCLDVVDEHPELELIERQWREETSGGSGGSVPR